MLLESAFCFTSVSNQIVSGGVRIIIDIYEGEIGGVDMRSVYCVFEHLIFMDLERSPK